VTGFYLNQVEIRARSTQMTLRDLNISPAKRRRNGQAIEVQVIE
jgi:hypothetical protein